MEFKLEFESQLSEIEKDIVSQKQTSEELLKSLDALQSKVKSRLNTLTTFDQEKYDNELQRVRGLVWKQNRAGRFRFKSTSKVSKAGTTNKAAVNSNENTTKPTFKTSVSVVYEEQRLNLNLSNYENSVIVAHNVSNSVYVENCEQSKIYASCHQCRVHNCQDLEIYLESCRNPVIESCNNITFIVPDNLGAVVSDFSWMQPGTPSPHYRIEIISSRAWKPLSEYTTAVLNR